MQLSWRAVVNLTHADCLDRIECIGRELGEDLQPQPAISSSQRLKRMILRELSSHSLTSLRFVWESQTSSHLFHQSPCFSEVPCFIPPILVHTPPFVQSVNSAADRQGLISSEMPGLMSICSLIDTHRKNRLEDGKTPFLSGATD
ncbi:hypothetical protein RRG08_055406 [Elysia crispata]|uniref:Uncharacterized protein n=1 Tax=Elysia crispata TaxID=231223 RepID=A0AAE1AQM7_9GAST|nr:hypothetical protein RRG08_055406 [Elysia crispata]